MSQVGIYRRGFLYVAGISGAAIAFPRWVRADERAAASEETLRFHTRTPNNAEPPLGKLVESWITPKETFYIRSHGPNPDIDEAAFSVSVEGMVRKPLKLAPGQIREQARQATVTATLTCAGNRRREHSEIKPVSGVPWGAGAIGNATWSGAILSEILKQAEMEEGARHVWFEGADRPEAHGEKIPFGGSIPLEKAMAMHGASPGALLAWKMNDAPLSLDHGFPVRTIVPGYIGARSVKWLTKIVVSDRPSPNHFVSEVYKLISEETPEQIAQADPIYKFPINAVIAVPDREEVIKPGKTKVQGYALPPGEPGRTIQRVELSADGGLTWREAKLDGQSSPFCWRLWSAELELNERTKELIVRAIDSSGQQQPQATPWNVKGYLFNAWHRRQIHVAG
jgi:sulfite oxidase